MNPGASQNKRKIYQESCPEPPLRGRQNKEFTGDKKKQKITFELCGEELSLSLCFYPGYTFTTFQELKFTGRSAALPGPSASESVTLTGFTFISTLSSCFRHRAGLSVQNWGLSSLPQLPAGSWPCHPGSSLRSGSRSVFRGPGL